LPLEDFHRVIISTALRAARAAGFTDVALGGGNALIVRARSTRPTRDVDLFCRKPSELAATAAVIIEALESAGYQVARRESEANWWDEEEAEGQLVELVVSAPGGREAEVQIAHFFYAEDAVVPDLGAVLTLPDLGGWKTTTVPNRMEPRDYVDYALLRKVFAEDPRLFGPAAERHPGLAPWACARERLFELAAERDPGLTPEDYADAVANLKRLKDADLAPFLAPGQDAAEVRAAFADWPR
jgi:hypothetical protein